LQTRTSKAARGASAKDGASQSILLIVEKQENQNGFRVRSPVKLAIGPE